MGNGGLIWRSVRRAVAGAAAEKEPGSLIAARFLFVQKKFKVLAAAHLQIGAFRLHPVKKVRLQLNVPLFVGL